MDDLSSLLMLYHPYWWIIIHMDDVSSIWMIYHAAAGAAAMIGEMYLRANIFQKKWIWKNDVIF